MKLPMLLLRALLIASCGIVRSHAYRCTDSTLKFVLESGRTKTCDWVGDKPKKNCKRYKTHCPNTCDFCDPCSDSMETFKFQKELFTCAVINTMLCKKKAIFNTCPETCDKCPKITTPPTEIPTYDPTGTPTDGPSGMPTTSKVPSLAPSTSVGPTTSPTTLTPTMIPSTVPSDSLAPTMHCVDSTLRFDTKDPQSEYNGKTCRWVRQNLVRCKLDNVETHCPFTCGACEPCSDSKAIFYFKGSTEEQTCKMIENKCSKKGVFHTCRATCGLCPSLSPSNAITSDPSALPSMIPSVGPSTLPTTQPSVLPTSLLSQEPTVSNDPSSNPTYAPTCYGGENLGFIEEVCEIPTCDLHECAGNCRTDDDCRDGLKCLIRRRKSSKKVPFCIGSAYKAVNYCIRMDSEVPSVTLSHVPTLLPSSSPSLTPSVTHTVMPSNNPSASPSTNPSSLPSVSSSSMPSSAPSISSSTDPSSVPSVLPTSMPSSLPTQKPSISLSPSANPSSSPSCYGGLNNGRINNVNPGPNGMDCPLHECVGSCTTNSCREGLFCLKRTKGDSRIVPGCNGLAFETNNYCIKTPSDVPSVSSSNDPSSVPSVTPTSNPSYSPSTVPSAKPSMGPSMYPSSTPSTAPSVTASDNPTSKPSCYGGKGDGNLENIGDGICPLNECTGDCDEDSDCKSGLNCFQRSGNDIKIVPGCEGEPEKEIDYCIERDNSSPPSASSSILPSNDSSALPSVVPSVLPSVTSSVAPSVTHTPSSMPSYDLSGTIRFVSQWRRDYCLQPKTNALMGTGLCDLDNQHSYPNQQFYVGDSGEVLSSANDKCLMKRYGDTDFDNLVLQSCEEGGAEDKIFYLSFNDKIIMGSTSENLKAMYLDAKKDNALVFFSKISSIDPVKKSLWSIELN